MRKESESMDGKEFTSSLKAKGFAPRSIAGICRNIRQLRQWAEENGHSLTNISYELIKDYMFYCKSRNLKPGTINSKIRSISCYNSFFNGENTNIALSQLRVKGTVRGATFDLFTTGELDNIYNQYLGWSPRRTKPENLLRNHIILGLHIYQGIKHGELAALETYHANLEKGRIYIPSTSRSNSRYLDLMPFQVMPLHNYITNIRSKMLQKYPSDGQKLFPGYNDSRALETICKTISKHCPKLKKFSQIRASVITNWLTRYNLRETQYMAGHRYVSSTERYCADKLEDLQKELEKYHPLKNN